MTARNAAAQSHIVKATWSLFSVVLFGCTVAALLVGVRQMLSALAITLHSAGSEEGPRVILGTLIALAATLAATALFARVQHRSTLDYGLRDRGWIVRLRNGVTAGLLSLSVVVLALVLTSHLALTFSPQDMLVSLGYGVLWCVGYLLTGLFEEILFRGYPLKRLTQGFGFVFASLATSMVFGLIHLSNGLESWLAASNAIALAVVLALSVRMTGSLWWAIGFHAAWNWAESFLFGCPDSGIVAQGRMLSAKSFGAAWLSGGSAGPEGSAFMILGITGAAVLLTVFVRRSRADSYASGHLTAADR